MDENGRVGVRQPGQPMTAVGDPFRVLPSIDLLLREPEIRQASSLSGEALAVAVREALRRERQAIRRGARPTNDEVRARIRDRVARLESGRLTPILNATGIVIHTNLGRAPVSEETAAAMAAAAANYVPLEIDAESNERGGRMGDISRLLNLLTRAEASLVVNNNAAAILLVLSAIAAGRSVVLSRGEAVEIGGGFRVPAVMQQSGSALVEVGTTNRTYAKDYAAAIDEQTAALLKVHRSNFRVIGFTHETSLAELVEVARTHELPVIEDQGSGALLDTVQFGLAAEPTLGASIAAGATVVTASGDKLLGGPQAGLILGSAAMVSRIAAHPLARAVRADKTCLAGVAATLRHYAQGKAVDRIPVWRMIATSIEDVRERGRALQARLARQEIAVELVPSAAAVGGGALPGQELPSYALALGPGDGTDGAVDAVARRLRLGQPAVFGHIAHDRLLLDLRTILPEQDHELERAIVDAFTTT
jgi:L-seryl-tRNA(Ser) seleniumtransferase